MRAVQANRQPAFPAARRVRRSDLRGGKARPPLGACDDPARAQGRAMLGFARFDIAF
jgi:hypothetical protein